MNGQSSKYTMVHSSLHPSNVGRRLSNKVKIKKKTHVYVKDLRARDAAKSEKVFKSNCSHAGCFWVY